MDASTSAASLSGGTLLDQKRQEVKQRQAELEKQKASYRRAIEAYKQPPGNDR